MIAIAIIAPHPHLSNEQGRHCLDLSASSPVIRVMFS